ncbi:MAG: hypothetical protein QHI48_08865 [Bacteroidota bacterium]|nr:hypothetical protein [Bacteroidota bacterium]
MKHLLIGMAFAALVLVAPSWCVNAQTPLHHPGSIGSLWDRPCPLHPSSTVNYPWYPPRQPSSYPHACVPPPQAGPWERTGVFDASGRSAPCAKTYEDELFRKNRTLIDALYSCFCVPQQYVQRLESLNNYAYGASPAPGTHPQPDSEAFPAGRLENLNRELTDLLGQCAGCK